MTDLLTRLTEARPTPTELDALWSPAARQARLDALRPARRRTRPARRVAVLAAAAAGVAVLVVPPVLDSGDAVAADLRALADAAAVHRGPVLAEGTWLHERSTSLQRDSAVLRDGAVLDTERETWTSWDGVLYLVERRPSAGWTSYDVLDEQREASISDPTPALAATLPDDPAALLAHLDPLVQGSSSHDEALFEALRVLVTSGTLPPRTLAAALAAFAEVDGVDTDDVVVGGREAVEVVFTEHHLRLLGTDSLVVDRATGQVLSMRQTSPAGDYTSTTTLSEVVDAVPAAVLAAFETHGDGSRVWDEGVVPPAGG